MSIQEFLENREMVAVDVLTAIAGQRAAFGEDVETALRRQAELRVAEAERLTGDETKRREDGSLLASDARQFDRLMRERDSILALLRHVEARSAASYRVPESQATVTTAETLEIGPVLTREQRCADWLRQRGGAQYAGERGADQLRFGRIVRALALGDRRGMSDLEQRVLSEGVDSAGGFTTPEILATRFIDRVRSAMTVQRAGAQIVPMTSDVLHVAKLSAPGIHAGSPPAPAPTWKAENNLIVEGDLTLERVSFTARTLPVLLKLSVELSEDSVNVDQIIEAEMAAALALELDRAALFGSGSAPEPRGIRNVAAVNVEDLSGTAPTDFDFLVDSIGRVWAANHEPNARIYNASLATRIAKFKSSADSQPLRVPEAVAAVPAFRTNQIPNANTSPDSSTLFIGDFTQLMIGMRTSFRLEVTRTGGSEVFERLQIAVRAYLRADVQLAHAEAFDVTLIGL